MFRVVLNSARVRHVRKNGYFIIITSLKLKMALCLHHTNNSNKLGLNLAL
jgi:hypothetical protein